ncbi:MAG: hypothetical protein EA357_09160 [Micavibrio sp.]|nr:MAG: hypothetical protein EA357_09160 [Micavibrio sp.]
MNSKNSVPQHDTYVIELFNRESYRNHPPEAVTTIITGTEDDLKTLVQEGLLKDSDYIAANVKLQEGGYARGKVVAERKYYVAENENDLKPITDIRFDGDYADIERQETFDFYDKKDITHVFTVLGAHYDVDENTVVLRRDGSRLWPAAESAKPAAAQDGKNNHSGLDKQRHLRRYLRGRKPL